MAIVLNGKTKLTAEIERKLVQLGGADPGRTLTKAELSLALVNAVDELHAQGRTGILEKIYLSHQRSDSTLPSLEQLHEDAEKEDRERNETLRTIESSANVVLFQHV